MFRVLEGLLKDDDEVIAVWYLMGWLHCLTKDDDSARFYLEQTLAVRSALLCARVVYRGIVIAVFFLVVAWQPNL